MAWKNEITYRNDLCLLASPWQSRNFRTNKRHGPRPVLAWYGDVPPWREESQPFLHGLIWDLTDVWEETREKKGSAASPLSELSQHCFEFLEDLVSPCHWDGALVHVSPGAWRHKLGDQPQPLGCPPTLSVSLNFGHERPFWQDCLKVASPSNKTVKIPQGGRGIWDKHSLPDIAKETRALLKRIS